MTVNVDGEQVARCLAVLGHCVQLQVIVGIVHHPAKIGGRALCNFVANVGYDLRKRGFHTVPADTGNRLHLQVTIMIVITLPCCRFTSRRVEGHPHPIGIEHDIYLIQAGGRLGSHLDNRMLSNTGK